MRTKRKSLVEQRYYEINKKQMTFLIIAREKAAKLQTSSVTFIPNDIMFNIFLSLPVKSLLRFTCVCKSWFKLIHCAEFVEAYNAHVVVSTPVILRRFYDVKPNTLHVEPQRNCSVCKDIHYLEIENEKGKLIDLNVHCSSSIVASCNGLILITSIHTVHRNWYRDHPLVVGQNDAGRLIVMNPVTRKMIGFPLGTLPCGYYNESYGLMYSHSTGVFKVVHLFKEKSGAIGCEILSLQTQSWKVVDGPSEALFSSLGQAPFTALGVLHWLPGSTGLNYIISMRPDDEKFFVTYLPKNMEKKDRLLEMGGFLTFVKCLGKDHFEVWVLKGLDGTQWIKQHIIQIDASLGDVGEVDDMGDVEYSLPSFALNAKEMVFNRNGRLYTYDFKLEEIREIEMDRGSRIKAYETIIPHSSNLATWEPLEPLS